MNTQAIIPVPKHEITFRIATMADIPAIDALQKQHSKALGFFRTEWIEGYINSQWILLAVDAANRVVGYIASRDRYLKRDELGIIYQLCVAPGEQRKLVGAALVREAFARSAYGCRLYCCWCAQDLDANHFWESMGFVPVAFRAGSSGKKRVHIFWQKRIVEGDTETKWWYPSQTNQGAIREDRLVFPIPPGVHWKDVEATATPVASPGTEPPQLEDRAPKQVRIPKPKTPKGRVPRRRVQFGPPDMQPIVEEIPKPPEPAKRERQRTSRPKVKIDPKLVEAARELRDKWMERMNADPSALLSSNGKYQITRQIESSPAQSTLFQSTPKLLPVPTTVVPTTVVPTTRAA